MLGSQIEAAVQKFGRTWTEEQREAFREQVAAGFEDHPFASRLLRWAAPDLDASHEVRREDGAPLDAPELAAAAGARNEKAPR